MTRDAISRDTIRSSVRPKSSKQPWGTIIEPEFGMGHQRSYTAYEVSQVVDRLYYVPTQTQPPGLRVQQKPMKGTEIKTMLSRLTSAKRIPDSDRTQSQSIYRPMGVVNSYAWRGYN